MRKMPRAFQFCLAEAVIPVVMLVRAIMLIFGRLFRIATGKVILFTLATTML